MQRIKQNRHYVFATLGVGGILAAAGMIGNNAPLLDSADSFVLLARDQITIGSDLSLSSGSIGVNDAKGKLVIAAKSNINGDLYADTVTLAANTTINGFVTTKKLTGPPIDILGETSTSFSSPLVAPFPTIPDFSPGTQNIIIPQSASQTLTAGSYKDLKTGPNTSLTFEGGTYTFNKVDIGSAATLHFLAPTTLNIADTASFGPKTVFSPDTSLVLEDIALNIRVRSVSFGPNSFISGIVTAPEANVMLGSKSTFRGQLIGQKIGVGSGVILSRSVSFTQVPQTDDIVIDPDGGVYPVNELILHLEMATTFAEADEIISNIGGRIIGYLPSINLFQIQFSTDTIGEIEVELQTLLNLGDPRIKGAFRNYSIPIDN